MVEAAQAILGVTIPTTALCGQDFTDQRYENLKTRFLLRLGPDENQLMQYSTYVDDALDLFAQVPVVGRAAARDWYARILHVTYAAVWVRDALKAVEEPHQRLRAALDADSATTSKTRDLLVPSSHVARDQPWYGAVIAPATVRMVGSIWSRVTEAVTTTKRMWAQEEELIFSLMHLQRGLQGGRDNIRVSRSWMVFHAAKLARGGMGLIADSEAQLRKNVQLGCLLELPRLNGAQIKSLVANAEKRAKG